MPTNHLLLIFLHDLHTQTAVRVKYIQTLLCLTWLAAEKAGLTLVGNNNGSTVGSRGATFGKDSDALEKEKPAIRTIDVLLIGTRGFQSVIIYRSYSAPAELIRF